MSSRRNHAARSRKTHKYSLWGARHALRGTLPYEVRRSLYNQRKAKEPEDEKE